VRRERKKERELEEERKAALKRQKAANELNERKRQQVLEQRKRILKDREKELKDREKQVQDQYNKYLIDKEERQRKQQDEMFAQDLEQMKDIKDRHGTIHQKIKVITTHLCINRWSKKKLRSSSNLLRRN
jgi:hypothetical protein